MNKLLDAVTTLATKSAAIDASKFRNLTFYTQWATGTTAGAVVYESSPTPDAADAMWTAIATVTYDSGAPKTVVTNSNNTFGYVRARVSTGITGTGASVTSWMVGA